MKTMNQNKFSIWLRMIAILLTILFLVQVLPMAVWASDYTESVRRKNYFNEALPDYLKQRIETDGAVRILEYDQVNTEEGNNASDSYAINAASEFGQGNVNEVDSATESSTAEGVSLETITIEKDDGENVSYVFSEPISYIDDEGRLVYKDTGIYFTQNQDLKRSGYTYENGTNDYKIYFSKSASKGILLQPNSTNKIYISPKAEKQAKDGTLETQTEDGYSYQMLSYENAFGRNTTLRYSAQLNGSKEEIILNRKPKNNTFSFTVKTENAVAAINSFGDIEIIDNSTGEVANTLTAPYAYDSSGGFDPTSEHFMQCIYSLQEKETNSITSSAKIYDLTITVPEEYLSAETTEYPVTIDPTTSNLTMRFDTALYSGKPATINGANPTANFGRSPSYGYGWAMFYFWLPDGLDSYAKITSAKLYLRETTGSTSDIVCYPYLITSTWYESSVNWNTKPTHTRYFTLPGSSSTVSMPTRVIDSTSTDISGSRYWYAMDISNAVKAWTTNRPNKGIIFASMDSNSADRYLWRAFATKEHSTSAYRPYAIINYTNDTTAPTITGVSGNATEYTSDSVTLTVTATDNVYGVEYYSFDNGFTWQSSNQKTFSSNQEVIIKAKDYAGNISAPQTVNIDKIDKENPEIEISLNPEDETYGTVTASVTITDNVGLQNITVNGEEVPASGTSKTIARTFESNGAISISATDLAGNTATSSENIENILLTTADTTAPSKPDIYEEENKIYVRSRSFTFDENSESPETTQYKIGNGEWQEYTESLELINTVDTTIYARVRDAAGNISEEGSLVKKSRLGEYTASFQDIVLGSNLLPFRMGRTYSSTDGWSFTWNAKLEQIQNGYVYTDFDGKQHFYLLNATNKYVDNEGKELETLFRIADDKTYHFKLEKDGLTCYFDTNRNLVAVESETTQATFTRTTSSIVITDKLGGTATVTLNADGNPTGITYVSATSGSEEESNPSNDGPGTKTVAYTWTNGKLGTFTDAAGNVFTYVYTDNRMTGNDDTTIDYGNGRVKRILYKDNSFVRFTYDDNAVSENTNTPNNLGRVTMNNSKGITDYCYYVDEFDPSSVGFDSYSGQATYHPDNIDFAITTNDVISNQCYVVQRESESNGTEDNSEEESGDSDSDSGAETRPLYDQNEDGSYNFYSYDNEEQLTEALLVPVGALSVTGETTYAQAETAATKKYVYSYTITGKLATYAILSNTGAWLQEYGEEYTYDALGNPLQKRFFYITYSEDAEAGSLVPTTTSSQIEYTYDAWGQCVKTVYSAPDMEDLKTETGYDLLGRQNSLSVQEGTNPANQTNYTYDKDGNVLTVVNTEGTTTYTYSNGRLQSRTGADQTTASYTYDLFGNLTNHSYNGYTFTYNTLGSILTAGIGSQTLASYTYSVDPEQNVLVATYGNGSTVNRVYNEEKELTQIKDGDVEKYQFSYTKNNSGDITVTTATDVVNQVVRILEENKTTVQEEEETRYSVETLEKTDTDPNSINGTKITLGADLYQLVSGDMVDTYSQNGTTRFTRTREKDRNGNVTGITFAPISGSGSNQATNTITTSYGYGITGAVTALENTLNDLKLSYNYGYNASGNITSETLTRRSRGTQGETQVSTEQTSYSYDSKGQLLSAENNTKKWEYTYNSRGNLLSRKEYTVTVNTDGTRSYAEQTAERTTYTYDTAWPDKLVSYKGQGISYDVVGNPTSYLGKTLSWSFGRQLSSIDNISFAYNEDGIRIGKTVGDTTTKYYLNGTNVIYQTDGTNALYFYYDSDGSIIGFEYANNLYCYMKNLQGDITGIADANGAIQTEYTYDPWGKVISVTGNETLGNLNPFRYRGYCYDTETGLYYLQSRYYDPQTGRFLNSDDVNYIGTTESEISYNPFAYCENNPINLEDQSGNAAVLFYFGMYGLAVLLVGASSLILVHSIGSSFRFWNTWGSLGTTSGNYLRWKLRALGLAYYYTTKLASRIRTIVKKLALSFAKARTLPKKGKNEWHHVIAKRAQRAFPARWRWLSLGNDINSIENLVYIKYGLHRRLHTNEYYSLVNDFVSRAYDNASGSTRKKKVRNVVRALKDWLQFLDKVSPF